MKKFSVSGLIWLFSAVAMLAQGNDKPTYRYYSFEDGGIIQRLSDNGLWAVACGASAEDANYMSGARLVDVSTGVSTLLTEGLNTDTVFSSAAFDVTDDGNIVVGLLNNRPAYYTVSTGKWTCLDMDGEANQGMVNAVTPDGKYAVGRLNYSDPNRLYEEKVALWDLTTNQLLPTPGIPTRDMAHMDQKMNRFTDISPDGNTIVGCMSFSYLPTSYDLGGNFCYVYHRDKQSYSPIGFDETETGRWHAHVDGIMYITHASLSNNGRYVSGGAYMVKEVSGSEFPSEYEIPYVYDVETGVISLYDDTESTDKSTWCVDNNGQVYAASPSSNPYRDFSVRSGKYWIGFTESVNQLYGVDVVANMGQENSGTPVSVDDQCLTIASVIGPHESYVVTLPESLPQMAGKTNLLSSYGVTPKAGATLSKLTTLQLTFDRKVSVAGDADCVQLLKVIGSEEVARSVGFAADGNTVTIKFRKGTLSDGEPYRVLIPAKTICLANDPTRYNNEIRITYVGRDEKPVAVTASSPKDGATLGKLDLATSPITLTFDTGVLVADAAARGKLYQEGIDIPFADLLLAYGDNKVMAYPSTTQYLYKDVAYRVEIPAGLITDVTGNANTANELIVLNFQGAYEREISYDENVLFSDDFSEGLNNFMLLDNDLLTPSEASQALGFTQNNYAWVPVWDEHATTNLAAGSTSMYNPAGQSDDWLVIPQLHIVDQLCSLSFKSQSYISSATDRLKVYVWENNNVYNGLNASIVNKIRTEGTLVYDEVQSPGEKEGELAGDWRENTISLKDFAGKYVYIAFVNDNTSQSAVFIDDVKVLHDLPYFVAITNDDTFVGATEAVIEGVVDIRDKEEVFTTAQLTLRNAQGETVDEIKAEGLNLKAGDKYEFAFAKPLPLQVGEVNGYSIDLKFNDIENSLSKSIKVLAFTPTKRVVLEEFTGVDCTNCPLGHEVIDKLASYYGDLFIPMALHCYTGDPYAVGVTNYAAYLNLTAAPSAIIQRSGAVTYPMVSTEGGYTMYAPEGTNPLWIETVAAEMNKETEAEISSAATLSADGSIYTVPVELRYALNADKLNLKLFIVVLENGLVSYQKNGFSSVTDENLGEWGKGGRYGVPMVSPFTFNHVVRGWEGSTFTGTPDLLPESVRAGEVYTTELQFEVPATVSDSRNTDLVLMLFDGNTDRLINACKVNMSQSEGIGGPADRPAADIRPVAGGVQVNTGSTATVQLLAADGRVLAQTGGQGLLTLRAPGYQGVAIVRVVTAAGVVTGKVAIGL